MSLRAVPLAGLVALLAGCGASMRVTISERVLAPEGAPNARATIARDVDAALATLRARVGNAADVVAAIDSARASLATARPFGRVDRPGAWEPGLRVLTEVRRAGAALAPDAQAARDDLARRLARLSPAVLEAPAAAAGEAIEEGWTTLSDVTVPAPGIGGALLVIKRTAQGWDLERLEAGPVLTRSAAIGRELLALLLARARSEGAPRLEELVRATLAPLEGHAKQGLAELGARGTEAVRLDLLVRLARLRTALADGGATPR